MKRLPNIFAFILLTVILSSLSSCASRMLLVEEQEYFDTHSYPQHQAPRPQERAQQGTYQAPRAQPQQRTYQAPRPQPQQPIYQETRAAEPIRPPVNEYTNSSAYPRVIEEKVINLTESSILKEYNIVCGSFKSKENSDEVMAFLYYQGYTPLTIYDPKLDLHRVISGSFHNKENALFFQNEFRQKYAQRADFRGAWILTLPK